MRPIQRFSIAGVLSLCGFGCGAAPVAAVMYTVLLWLGTQLLTSAVGYSLEQALDSFFSEKVPVASIAIREVEVSPNDPLRGIVKHPLIVELEGGASVEVESAAVVRSSHISEDWHIDPQVREEIRAAARKFE